MRGIRCVIGRSAGRAVVLGLALGLLSLLGASSAHAESVSFTSPGCTTWTVPATPELMIRAVGAEGSSGKEGGRPGPPGGQGAEIVAGIRIASRTSLTVCVNVGGGTAGSTCCAGNNGVGGAGGGASGVSTGEGFSSPLLIAAGGGGGGGGGLNDREGGTYGGSAGERGGGSHNGYFAGPGEPGTSSAPGEGGPVGEIGERGETGGASNASGPGAGGGGGLGKSNCGPCWGGGGGGGGGGYYGGGGGGGGGYGGGGGGGGSSLVPPGGTATLALRSSTPQVVISYELGPSATTEPASEITFDAAKLNGSVDTDGFSSEACFFEYGETSLYGQTAECKPPEVESETPRPVTARIHGLSPKTHYHYRLVLTAEEQTVYGSDQEFETGPEPPIVTGISPSAGFEAGGNTVDIAGAGLAEATRVRFGNTQASFTVNSDSSITAAAPSHEAGALNVIVENVGGESAISAADRYTYVAHGHAPTLAGLSAKKGPAAGGNQVMITGTSFAGVTAVRFGDAEATYAVESSETLVATAPPGATGKTEVTVTTPNGESGIAKKAAYTYGSPTVSGVSPGGQPLTVANPITITGSGFQRGSSETSFKLGKAQATNVSCSSTSSCTATAPASTTPRQVDVVAASAGKKSRTNPSDHFLYETPAITSVSPSSGPRQGGTSATILGSGFAPGKSSTTFSFGKGIAILVECPSQTECAMLSPASSSPGMVDVRATVANTTSAVGPSDRYTFE